MVGIIVVFPNKDNATNIRNLLVRAGLNVTGVCTTGAQAMNYADSVDEGIIVCGYKLKDMMYSELREYLPDREEGLASGVMGLTMPIKAYDLMNTLQMMLQNMERRRRKRKKTIKSRTPEQEALIRKAKELLMARNNMTEEEAHRYLQKNSMDSGTNIVETAEMVLSIMNE